MSSRELTYLELLKLGKAKPEDFSRYVDLWHEGKGGGKNLNQFLGFSKDFFKKFVVSGGSILRQLYNTERYKLTAAKKIDSREEVERRIHADAMAILASDGRGMLSEAEVVLESIPAGVLSRQERAGMRKTASPMEYGGAPFWKMTRVAGLIRSGRFTFRVRDNDKTNYMKFGLTKEKAGEIIAGLKPSEFYGRSYEKGKDVADVYRHRYSYGSVETLIYIKFSIINDRKGVFVISFHD